MGLGAILTAAAPLVGGALGFAGNERTNASNAHQAAANRDFQERMSSTSYQRAVADMKAAGLNPALAYSQGGASSPGGAQATMTNSLAGGGGAAEAGLRIQEIQNMKATREATQAQAAKTGAETAQINLESMARLQEIQQRIALMGEQVTDARTFRPLQQDVLFGTARASRMQSYKTQSETRFLDNSFEQRLEELKAIIRSTNANARAANAEASVKELFNRPLLEGFWDRYKNSEGINMLREATFDGPFIDWLRKNLSRESFRGHGGGASW